MRELRGIRAPRSALMRRFRGGSEGCLDCAFDHAFNHAAPQHRLLRLKMLYLANLRVDIDQLPYTCAADGGCRADHRRESESGRVRTAREMNNSAREEREYGEERGDMQGLMCDRSQKQAKDER